MNSKCNELSILLSGPGLIGTQHARLIKAHPRCQLAAIVAPSTDENIAIADRMGAPRYMTIEEALASKPIDGAIISSPNEFHFSQTMTCIEHRIPTLVEKPITDSLADAIRLTLASERIGVPIAVGHHRAFSPLLEAAAAFLRTDDFGDMVAMQGAALFYKPTQYFLDGPWRMRAGGGPILINLIHEIGIMRYFAGEIASVTALSSHRTRQLDVEDTVAISMAFKNGALGTFILSDTAASSKSWEMTSGENPAYPYFPTENCWHLAGTRGSLDFPSMKARTYPLPGDRSWWNAFDLSDLTFSRHDPLQAQFDHFVRMISDGVPPRVTSRDGYNNLLVIAAIQQAITSHTVVSLAALEHDVGGR